MSESGVEVETEERDQDGAYAGLEWLIPTAVIVFIGKAYIDGFLKEMGKDHYSVLKRGLKSLYERFVGPKAPVISLVGTAGKISSANPYSLVFSLLAEAPDGLRFKLLVKSSATETEYEATLDSFLKFVCDFHDRNLNPEVVQELRGIRAAGKTMLLAYDSEKKRVVPVDPLAGRAQ